VAIFYRPPADIDDFSRRPALAAALRQRWHDFIASAVAERASEGGLFYDAADDPAPGVAPARAPLPWNGFPRSIWQWFNADADPQGADRAFAAAEVLQAFATVRRPDGTLVTLFQRQQDEYCEWHADDPGGPIRRISFTVEGPEYFATMAETDLTLVGDLYREHVNPAVRDEDLVWDTDMTAQGSVIFRRGTYNRWNKWNTDLGAMHLTHRANTLGAEINLAADAASLFPVQKAPAATFPTRLICCAGIGGVNRSSDPLISAGVNGFASQGLSVTLDNPIGLYIQTIALDGLRDPGGAPIGPSCLKIVRANPDGSAILRAEVTPPDGADFTLDQCTFEGQPITGGGVIARRITMVLFGLAKAIPGRTGVQASCSGKCCSKPGTAGFLKLVSSQRNCALIPDAEWRRDAPATAPIGFAPAAEPTSESSADWLTAALARKRAPIGQEP
jgi:hypothetical protein